VLNFSIVAKRVVMVVRGSCLRETLSEYLVDRIRKSPKVTVLHNSEVRAIDGHETLESLEIENTRTGARQTYRAHRFFICIGGDPQTAWAEEVGIVRDEAGYLVTGTDLFRQGKLPENWPLDRSPYFLETNRPGVFAAGDVRHGSVKRCASAVGEGAMAVALVHRYLAGS
jgi:thioredoxin reductase (NADPH)